MKQRLSCRRVDGRGIVVRAASLLLALLAAEGFVLPRGTAPSFRAHRFSGTARTAEALETEEESPKAVTGPISDVEYVYVNTREGEDEAIDDDVLRRVNMVSRAQQGRYKVPEGIPDTEHGVGALTAAFTNFPTTHSFQVVGRTADESEREAFVDSVVGAIEEHVGGDVPLDRIVVRERLGGRYTSVIVKQGVQSAQQISDILGSLSELPRVVMHF
mmetsp:Transcript_51638/g.116372  ORF Transcript_51638/g.116372 Transcript_51638/m.116372 type:complete len:216 (-) Transcript_51638:82-729(-)